ncbi:MAG: hypothetical protein A3F18_00850 [Legionellales bacterium RIFCSPHIGHO2_12_FULL_37_14]|nr:MAG: hypothetical protein A3F18_00850 [Legionellales bacterium RIFCSPHIGHO2_12_FULL_37_14]
MLIDLTLKINPKNATTPLAALGHYGTHIDVMENVSLPIEKFITVGKLIDITLIRNRLIQVEDIEHQIPITKNDFVIFRSCWLYDHDYGTKDYFFNHPQLSDAVIDYLLEKKISFIGLDFPGAQLHEKHKDVDLKCASQQVYLIENLNHLELITQPSFKAYCFPMHFYGNSGIPIRVIVEIG